MKPPIPPGAWLLTALVLAFSPVPVCAQFNLDRLKQAVDKAKSATQKVTDTSQKVADTAKDAGKIAKGLVGIGPEEERLIGESVAMEIIGRYGGLDRDEAITRRVNVLGSALAYYSTRPALPWRFGVLNSAAVNGFSTPGGWVFITRGLYDAVAGSDDQLAAVLAHEIAHVTERHALKIIARAEFIAGTTTLALMHSSDAAHVQAQLTQFDTGIADLVKTILEKGYDPNTEFAADTAGRELAVMVGYAPAGLRQVLAQLQRANGDPKTTFATHPPLADRMSKLPKDPPSSPQP